MILILQHTVENYMQHPPGRNENQVPGALNLGQTTATRAYCGFFILYFTIPIFIAPLADNHLGQYITLVLSLTVYVLGCVVMVVSSLPAMLDRGAGLPGLIVAMILIALGGGSVGTTHTEYLTHFLTLSRPRPS